MKTTYKYIFLILFTMLPNLIFAQNNPVIDKKAKAILDSIENAKKPAANQPAKTDTVGAQQNQINNQNATPLPVDTATQQQINELRSQDSSTGRPGKVKRLKEEEKAIKENRKRLTQMEKEEEQRRVEFLKSEEQRKKDELKQREATEKEVEKIMIENAKKQEQEIKENRKRLEDME